MGCNSLFFFVLLFGREIPGSKTEGQKLKNIFNGLLKV